MKPEELRIGNWVQDKYTSKEIKLNIKSFNGAVCVWRCKDIEPIPLTPEWLERFGFEVKSASVTHNHSYIKDNIVIQNHIRSGYYYDNIEIKYVHQLQNLYYALTGEEL